VKTAARAAIVAAIAAAVVSDRATLADALSTAAMVLDPAEATALVERSEAWVLLVDRSGNTTVASTADHGPIWRPAADHEPAH